MDDVGALVLAAGKGTRMGGDTPKVLVPLAGRPLVSHLLGAIEEAGVGRIAVVIGHHAELVRRSLGPAFQYVLQGRQEGMAHAVEVARPALDTPDGPGHLLVTVGDSPLLRASTIRSLLDRHRETGAALTFLTAMFPAPPPYARVLRDRRGRLTGCVEAHRASPAELAVKELLTSHFVFRARDLWDRLARIGPDPITGERYLTEMVRNMLDEGCLVETLSVPDHGELMGLNTPEELRWAEERLGWPGG